MVFDLDDALWLSRPHGTKALQWIASHANAIIAGNSYLAKWLSDYTENIHIIPTAIDTERFTPRPRDIKAGYPFVIGWTGTVTNLPYLENIEEPLLRFLNQYTVAEIRVMADHPPAFRTLPEARIRFVPWSMENEAAFVQQLDVGLMPLPDTKWTRGKCSFKMLQYMACCVPVIVSPVGMNAEVLALGQVGLPAINRDDWYEALANIYEDRTQAQKWGQAGRSVTKQYFSREVIARQLSEVFHRVVEA
ncbi:MAG: glycosyltransferase [Anaerolineae bacterium]|nr:glycosyltransferase [Anaerolineae bacterium]